MTTPVSNNGHSDRRRHPRYYVPSRLTLAIEDESRKESIGLGQPRDISLGGLRVTNLPASSQVRIGDHLALLLLDGEDALSLTAEVVHHADADDFGVEFRGLSNSDQKAVGEVIGRLHSRH